MRAVRFGLGGLACKRRVYHFLSLRGRCMAASSIRKITVIT